jgi:hypothetical protein
MVAHGVSSVLMRFMDCLGWSNEKISGGARGVC